MKNKNTCIQFPEAVVVHFFAFYLQIWIILYKMEYSVQNFTNRVRNVLFTHVTQTSFNKCVFKSAYHCRQCVVHPPWTRSRIVERFADGAPDDGGGSYDRFQGHASCVPRLTVCLQKH